MAADQPSRTFAALSDPTRRAILRGPSEGEATVTGLPEPSEMSLPAVSRHLKVLEHARLITRGREAQWRPCQLDAGPLKGVADRVADYHRFREGASTASTSTWGWGLWSFRSWSATGARSFLRGSRNGRCG